MRNHNNKTNQRAVTEPLQRDWCGKSLRMLSTYLPGPLQRSWWKQQKCKQSPEAWQKFGHLQMRRQFQSMNINITTTFELPWKHSCLSRQSFALVSLRKCRVFTGLCLFLVLRAKHGGSKNNASAFYFCDDVKKKFLRQQPSMVYFIQVLRASSELFFDDSLHIRFASCSLCWD